MTGRSEPPGPPTTDAELAAAAVAGDRAAFAAIYDRYADRLHDYCAGMLRDRDAAADCVQDTFCTAATKLVQLRDGDKLRPWLYATARNEALRHLRERRREEPTDMLPERESSDAGPETQLTRNELADLVADATEGLSDRDRQILDLTYRHELDGIELAEVLGVSRSNAGTLVARMRDTVERTLGALLVARQVDASPEVCTDLAAIIDGWDGRFTVLMRKRVARHIEACDVCESERRRMVTPAALLGGAPVFLPAPAWLRESTLKSVNLPASGGSASSGSASAALTGTPTHSATSPPAGTKGRRRAFTAIALVGLIIGAAVTIATLPRAADVRPVVVTTPRSTSTTTQPVSSLPAQFVPPPAEPEPIPVPVPTSNVPRTAPPTTTTLAPTARPPTTKVTTEVTQSFSPTTRSTTTKQTEPTTTKPETTTPKAETTTPKPETTPTKTSRPLPTRQTQTTTPPVVIN